MDIYHGLLPLEEAIDRIRNLYEPYHRQLQRLLAETCALFGHAVLVDCHSMPGLVRGPNGSQADVIIGDRYGSSSRPIVSRHALDGLRHAGFTVAHNRPYAGGYITEHYGRPASGIHAIQIEISRGLYMDERLMVPSKTFVETRERINLFLDQLMMLSSWDLSPFPMSPPIAAE
jgi:N-formylglutamate amidohydrolase